MVERRKISDLLFYQEGPGVRNTQYTTEGVKLLNVANLQDGEVDLSTSNRYISEEEAYGRYNHFLVDDGDFIIASSGIKVEYFEKKMGFINKSHLPLCMNTSTIRFKVLDNTRLDIRYFMYYLKSNDFKIQLSHQITGSAQLNFGPSHLKKMDMPLLPLSEQQHISKVLDAVSALIAKRKQQIALLDDVVKSLFVEMFGNYHTQNEQPLNAICNFIDYRGKTPEKSDVGIPLITAKNVKDNAFSVEPREFIPAENYDSVMTRGFPKVNDVLFTTEAPLGNVCRIPDIYEKFSVGQRIITMQPNEGIITAEYLEYSLLSKEFQDKMWQQSSGSTVKGIRSKLLEWLTIPIPPIELQKEFSARVEKIETQKRQFEVGLKKLEEIYQALMQEYFG